MGVTMTDQLDRFKLGAAGAGVKGGAFFRDKIREPSWYKTGEAIGIMVLIAIAGTVILLVITKRNKK